MAKTMLVIDDDSAVLESCRRVFSGAGYEVVTAGCGRKGLQLLSGACFDVVLCDWRMPEMDGMEILDLVDRRSPESAAVLITGFPTVQRAVEAMKRGAAEFLPKPFTPEELIAAVDSALRRKQAQRQAEKGRASPAPERAGPPAPGIEDRSPRTVAETMAQTVGVGKVTSPWLTVAVLGVLAGAYIGFGGLLSLAVSFDLAAHLGLGFTRLVSGAVFSLGLMLVVVAGAELFTGNNLMICSAMDRRIAAGRMLERWALVYAANFTGALTVALLFALSGVWKTGGGAMGAVAVGTAYARVSFTFIEALLRGIGCNWLVCLAVWMALSARQTIGKIFAVFFPIMGFVAIGFEHSVANMFFIPAGLLLRGWMGVPVPAGYAAGALSWGSFFLRNLLPVTIGNIIGGAGFVGMSYWSAYLRPAKAARR
jgi:formate/nitrite transporter